MQGNRANQRFAQEIRTDVENAQEKAKNYVHWLNGKIDIVKGPSGRDTRFLNKLREVAWDIKFDKTGLSVLKSGGQVLLWLYCSAKLKHTGYEPYSFRTDDSSKKIGISAAVRLEVLSRCGKLY